MTWPQYSSMSFENEITRIVDEFLEKNPQYDSSLKVGKSFIERIFHPPTSNGDVFKPRYNSTDKWEMLTLKNIICECTTEKLALSVEKMIHKEVESRGILVPNTDKTDGNLSSKDRHTFIVYITKHKSLEDRCPFCEKYFVDCDKLNHVSCRHAEEIAALRKFVAQFNKSDKKDNEHIEKINSLLSWTVTYAPKPSTATKIIRTPVDKKLSLKLRKRIVTEPSSDEEEVIKPHKASKKMRIIDSDDEEKKDLQIAETSLIINISDDE